MVEWFEEVVVTTVNLLYVGHVFSGGATLSVINSEVLPFTTFQKGSVCSEELSPKSMCISRIIVNSQPLLNFNCSAGFNDAEFQLI